MADYAADIIPADFLYKRSITITEKTGFDQQDLHLRLDLNSSSFNFDFARIDGLDFRLAEGNGTGVLNMFVGYWNYLSEKATLFFKLPSLNANETKTLYAFWGNATTSGISDIDSVDFLFADDFNGVVLDAGKWSSTGTYVISDSKIRIDNNSSYIQAAGDPLLGIDNWIMEDGFYVTASSVDPDNKSLYYRFYGTENDMLIDFYGEGDNDREHDFEESGVPVIDDGSYRGLKANSFHHGFVGYYESLDYVYQGFNSRDSYPDYLDTTERKCEGDTRVNYIRIYGKSAGGEHCYHDWIILRKFLGLYEPEWDLSSLYTDVEIVNPDTLAYDYGPDLTNVNFEHTSTSAGTTTNLSNDAYGTLSDTWCSSPSAAEGSGVDLIINFNAYGDELTDVEYLHYDDGHVLFLNASKLSDEDLDVNDNTYWQSTTSSGWACIDFGLPQYSVGAVMVKSVASNLSGMPKNYKIEGSFRYTDEWEDSYWKVLKEGQFSQSSDWQSATFENTVNYRFYRLKVLDTYGGNIALQEWKMYEYSTAAGKKVIAKINLKPASFSSQYIYFPKQIIFYGSNDLYNWTTLIATKNTYTPITGAWQEYTFTNTTPFYHYKLGVIGNWNNNSGKICIAEWEMREKTAEAVTHRVAAGTHNNFSSIWADTTSTFDDLDIYLVNDVISHIENGRLVATKTFTGSPTDLNVRS